MEMGRLIRIALGVVAAIGVTALLVGGREDPSRQTPPGRREVVFWHFWGGKDRAVVEAIVDRFNASQHEHFVRAVAMPGHNLDLKFFLSVAGRAPPDLLNQDDPIVADWALRDAIVPLDELATPEEYARLQDWLFPAAREIGSYCGQLYALCNGLDIRALYYDGTELDERGLAPPRTLEELDLIAEIITPPADSSPRSHYAFLPDPRRLWAWGIVFGGRFFDPARGEVTADSDQIVHALDWMASYSKRYGTDRVAAFRKGDQALSGAAFPLLQGRYTFVMDGQWRVPELAAHQAQVKARGEQPREYGVIPLPPPAGGATNAGWVNGNFFVVPRGCKNPPGAWAFAKFWSGFDNHEADAARACAEGGWIPASQAVVRQPEFQSYLRRYPDFALFVELAASPNQVPTPAVPGAAYFYSEIDRAAQEAMYLGIAPRDALERASQRVRARLTALETEEN